MNAEIPTPDLAECERFAVMWCQLTAAPHITLTAIKPDGPTDTLTFARGTGGQLRDWIARKQGQGDNVYFEVNEAPASCRTKPTKASMVAAVCRHADVDPMDEAFPFVDERTRLHGLVELLTNDTEMPPSFVIDSGNGIQPLWVIAREPLTPEAVERVEAENRAVEAALGAIGTHNVDRLLRLPGTVNFPNQKKRKRGRVACQARLLYAASVTYTADQAAGLGTHLQTLVNGSALVRAISKAKSKAQQSTATDAPELPDLLLRIEAATTTWPTLTRRWGGDWTDLKDASDSAKAMSLGRLLRRAGFTFDEMAMALTHHPDTTEWTRGKGEANKSRELHRIYDNADSEEEPADPELLDNPDMSVLRLVRSEPRPLPLDVFGPDWRRWIESASDAAACRVDYVTAPLLSSASAQIGNARWAQAVPGWAEPPHLWTCGVGDSGSGKSPGSDVLMRDILPEIERRMCVDFPDQMNAWKADAELHTARTEAWKTEVRTAQKGGLAPPLPPSGDPPVAPQSPRLRQNDVTVEKVAALLAAAAPKGLLIVRDELAGWLAGMNAYNDAGRAFWIESYGGRPYRVERQKHPEPIVVPHLAVAATGGAQPALLAEMFQEADDGLLARIAWFWPDPLPFRLGRTVPDTAWAIEAFDRLRLLQMNVADGVARPVMVPLATSALADLEAFGQEMQERQQAAGGLMRSALGKARGLAMRLALVLEFLWWCGRDGIEAPPTTISAAAFAAAAHLVADYLMPMAERVYGDAAVRKEDRNATTLARWIRKTGAKEVHVRNLQREVRLPGLGDAPAIRAAAAVLVEAGWLIPPVIGFGTARKVVYAVNPKVLEVSHESVV